MTVTATQTGDKTTQQHAMMSHNNNVHLTLTSLYFDREQMIGMQSYIMICFQQWMNMLNE